jgi:hypothetical protein
MCLSGKKVLGFTFVVFRNDFIVEWLCFIFISQEHGVARLCEEPQAHIITSMIIARL